MEVDELGSRNIPPTSNMSMGNHAFVPYQSPLHLPRGALLGNNPSGSSYNEDSDEGDEGDDECRHEDITRALNKSPHGNCVGPQSLTSG